jgi:hypothetical protein
MATQSRIDLQSKIDTNLADNTTGAITAALLREVATNVNDSSVNKTTDTNLIGLHEYDATKAYYSGEITVYDGNWYMANSNQPVGAFDPTYWDSLEGNVFHKSLTIETANVLTLFTTPIEIIPAVTGKTIVVNHAVMTVTYNSVAYATNTTVQLITDTAGQPQVEFLAGLNATTTRTYMGRLKVSAVAAGDTQLIASKSVKVQVQTGDPTAGNSQIKINVYYLLL